MCTTQKARIRFPIIYNFQPFMDVGGDSSLFKFHIYGSTKLKITKIAENIHEQSYTLLKRIKFGLILFNNEQQTLVSVCPSPISPPPPFFLMKYN